MNDLDLPEPITAYFEADRQEGAAVARCFTADGVVLDEGGTHAGFAAIETWKNRTSARYRHTVKPHTLETRGRRYIVTSQVSGDFPGSPLELRHTFILERGKIASLEIAP